MKTEKKLDFRIYKGKMHGLFYRTRNIPYIEAKKR